MEEGGTMQQYKNDINKMAAFLLSNFFVKDKCYGNALPFLVGCSNCINNITSTDENIEVGWEQASMCLTALVDETHHRDLSRKSKRFCN